MTTWGERRDKGGGTHRHAKKNHQEPDKDKKRPPWRIRKAVFSVGFREKKSIQKLERRKKKKWEERRDEALRWGAKISEHKHTRRPRAALRHGGTLRVVVRGLGSEKTRLTGSNWGKDIGAFLANQPTVWPALKTESRNPL